MTKKRPLKPTRNINEKLQVRLRLTQATNLSSKNKQTWAYFHKHIIKIITITESNFLFTFWLREILFYPFLFT